MFLMFLCFRSEIKVRPDPDLLKLYEARMRDEVWQVFVRKLDGHVYKCCKATSMVSASRDWSREERVSNEHVGRCRTCVASRSSATSAK